MKKIIIIGAGANALEIIEYIEYINNIKETYEIIGILDDSFENYVKNISLDYNYQYLGNTKEPLVRKDFHYFLAIANVPVRRLIIDRFLEEGAVFSNIIHPMAYMSPSAKVGVGNLIYATALIGPKVIVGNFNLLNAGVCLGHHTVLGDNNVLCPKVTISGYNKIGDNNLFGSNVSSFPGLVIGSSNVISAGIILDKNVPDRSTIYYRYKEKVFVLPKE
jgi:sugar O-acyltransferase (sialic acid O-acetyltransferase NeuD family)